MQIKQRIRRELHNLRAQLREQIWFPPQNPQGYIFRYGITVFLSLLIALFVLVFPDKEAKTIFYLVSLLSIVVSSYVGNSSTSILIVGFTAAIALLLYYPAFHLTPFFFSEIGGFIITGYAIAFLIEKAKRTVLREEFRKREQSLKSEIATLSGQKDYAEKEIRVRDEFISIASHELKTPLTTTLLKLQVALHNVRHVSLADFSVQNLLDMLESAEHQSKRLAKMVNDLLNVSIIRTGRLEMEIEECDIGEITKEVIHRFSEKAEREGVALRLNIADGVVGKCDKVRLEQVVSNLVSNSMKYGNGKPIDIAVTKFQNTGKITIKDKGIGISKEKLATIFNLFDRGVNGSEYRGLGIGLYISNQIIKAHGGRIVVHSKMNKGAEFIVEMPLS